MAVRLPLRLAGEEGTMTELDAIHDICRKFPALVVEDVGSIFTDERAFEEDRLKEYGRLRNRYALAVENTYDRICKWLDGKPEDDSPILPNSNPSKGLRRIAHTRKAYLYCRLAVEYGLTKQPELTA